MSDYWKGLMDWNCEGYQASKKVTGKTDSTLEINVLDVREQIQDLGKNVPAELFGTYVANKTKITTKE